MRKLLLRELLLGQLLLLRQLLLRKLLCLLLLGLRLAKNGNRSSAWPWPLPRRCCRSPRCPSACPSAPHASSHAPVWGRWRLPLRLLWLLRKWLLLLLHGQLAHGHAHCCRPAWHAYSKARR